MNPQAHNKLISFIWSIADDCLRDVYVRGKYRDVMLPMLVLRRLDSLLEPSKDKVVAEVAWQRQHLTAGSWDTHALAEASGYVFYNTAKWTLATLYQTASNNQQVLLANFEEYLQGFSENVQEIIQRFHLLAQVRHMAEKQVLLDVLEKFISPNINLTPFDKTAPDGTVLPALSNLGMGYVFEELIRKFNEENNEEAGEHFTPREVIELMTHLVFDPIKQTLPAMITLYDPACGSGGMLTEAENFVREKYPSDNRDILLFGKEINDETYAICKSDMLIKGGNPEHIKVGSTLSTDEFSTERFDFMLSNPPYGKSWASEQKYIKHGKDVIDPRFKVPLSNYWQQEEQCDATPRSSDGQLLFLMEMVSKMKSPAHNNIGSRVASVHNGSSLFTGDAGGGESNIRRYLIENDLLEAIIQLPNNLFYNTGITTYIWLLNNNKPAPRRGKVQLIDASLLFSKLRKNLGNKNCELNADNIARITQAFLNFENISKAQGQHIASQIFDNRDFGFYKVSIERPDRRRAQLTPTAINSLRFDKKYQGAMEYCFHLFGEQLWQEDFFSQPHSPLRQAIEEYEKAHQTLNHSDKNKLLNPHIWQQGKQLFQAAHQLMEDIGTEVFMDFNQYSQQISGCLKRAKLSAKDIKSILDATSVYDPNAAKVIDKTHTLTGNKLNALLEKHACQAQDLPDFGYYPTGCAGEYLSYASNSDLRDSESISLIKDGAEQTIHDYFLKEVKPHIEEAWINLDSVKIGYEISFNKYFYQYQALRSLEEVSQDILALEQEANGLIAQILARPAP